MPHPLSNRQYFKPTYMQKTSPLSQTILTVKPSTLLLPQSVPLSALLLVAPSRQADSTFLQERLVTGGQSAHLLLAVLFPAPSPV